MPAAFAKRSAAVFYTYYNHCLVSGNNNHTFITNHLLFCAKYGSITVSGITTANKKGVNCIKRIISLLLSVLLITTVFTALPFTASAATADGIQAGDRPYPDMPGGEFGACSWSFDVLSGKLFLSGTGNTGDFSSAAKPWADYNSQIEEVVVMNGIDTLGRSVFSNTPNLKKVSMAPSVTTIERDAFYKCESLESVTLSDNIAYVDIGAFYATGLKYITIPNSSCTLDAYSLGYKEGKSFSTYPVSNFTIYGYSGSTAQTYARGNSFSFVDLNSEEYDVSVERGSAYNLATGERVTKARAGEHLKAVADRMEKFTVFESFYTYNENIVLDESDWSFIMPGEYAAIHMNYYNALPFEIDLSDGSCAVSQDDYEYLTGLINSGKLSASLKENTTDQYYINLIDDSYILLTPTMIYTYDFDYAPSYSIALPNSYERNPIDISFAAEKISGGTLDLNMPEAGSPWNWETMQADITPGAEEWNAGRFTVSQATWYDHWGISAFTTFEGNKEYFVAFTLVPEDGYYFTLQSEMQIRVTGYDRSIWVKPFYMNSDGSVYYSAGSLEKQVRLVGGDPHSISVTNGFALLPDDETHITQAVPGQEVYIKPDYSQVDDDMYVVLGSMDLVSDDVEAKSSERIDTLYFYMPNNDVSGTVTFETEQQMNTVLPLYGGAVTVPDDHTAKSENSGVISVLYQKSASYQYNDGDDSIWYDVDGNGTWDIQRASGNVYTLLPTCSLTDNITLTLTREESIRTPVRSVKIQVNQPVLHSITVVGGVASTQRKDYYNEHVITEAEPGETVYIVPRSGDVDDDEYIPQFSPEATSDGVTICDESDISFVMPDKDVTVNFTYDIVRQETSILDFRYTDTVTLVDDGTNVRSEVYGVYMVLYLMSAAQYTEYIDELDRYFNLYDIDGDGNNDIEHDPVENVYWLLPGNSLPAGGIVLTLSRDLSWTLPIRTLVIDTAGGQAPPRRGDINRDGLITIEDVTLLQMHVAEYTGEDNSPIIDETDPISFNTADANCDGVIDVRDATAIQRHIAEYEELMP